MRIAAPRESSSEVITLDEADALIAGAGYALGPPGPAQRLVRKDLNRRERSRIRCRRAKGRLRSRHRDSFPISGPVSDRVCGKLVGVAGFEPATPSSRTRCATRLRYTPTMRRAVIAAAMGVCQAA